MFGDKHMILKAFSDCFDNPVEIMFGDGSVIRNESFLNEFPDLGSESVQRQLKKDVRWDDYYANFYYHGPDNEPVRRHLVLGKRLDRLNPAGEYNLKFRSTEVAGETISILEFNETDIETLLARDSMEKFYQQGRYLQVSKNFKSSPQISYTKADRGVAFPVNIPSTNKLGLPKGDFIYARRFDRSAAQSLGERDGENLASRTILVVGDSSGSGLHAASLSSIIVASLNQFIYSGGLKATPSDGHWREYFDLGISPMSTLWRSSNVPAAKEANPAWRILRATHFVGCSFYDRTHIGNPALPGAEVAVGVYDEYSSGEGRLFWANSGLLAFAVFQTKAGIEFSRLGRSSTATTAQSRPLLLPDADADNLDHIECGQLNRANSLLLLGTDGLVPKVDLARMRGEESKLNSWTHSQLRRALVEENPFESRPTAAYRLARSWTKDSRFGDTLDDDLALGLLFC